VSAMAIWMPWRPSVRARRVVMSMCPLFEWRPGR
jgi:hypothetical protein